MQQTGNAILENFFELMKCLMPYLDGGEFMERPGLVRIKCSMPTPLFNAVVLTQLSEEEARSEIASIRKEHKREQRPLTWYVYDGLQPSNLRALLEESGFCYNFSSPGMICRKLEDFYLDPVNELEVTPIETAEDVQILRAPLESFNLGDQGTRFTLAAFESAFGPEPAFVHFVGRFRGRPICSAALYLGKSTAGIYNIATTPEFRGRGFGRSITAHLLNHAKKLGFREAVLMSSRLGYSVYSKLGFEEDLKIDHYGSL